MKKIRLLTLSFLTASILPTLIGDRIAIILFPQRWISSVFTVTCLLIAIFLTIKDLRWDLIQRIQEHKNIFIALGLFAVLPVVGVFIHLLSLKSIQCDTVVAVLRNVGTVILFGMIFMYGLLEEKFLKWLYGLFLIPIFFVPVALFFPGVFGDTFWSSDQRLSGWENSPIFLGLFLIPPITFLLSFYVFDSSLKKRILVVVPLILSFAVLLGTLTRSSWLGVLFAFIVMVILSFQRMGRKKKNVIIAIFVFLVSIVAAFMLFPTHIQSLIVDRYHTAVDTGRLIIGLQEVAPGDPRLEIWSQSFDYMTHGFWGYGPTYYQVIDLVVHNQNSVSHWYGAHDIFLEAALTGGWALLALLIYSLSWLCKRILSLVPLRKFSIVLYSSFFGILINTLFIEGLSTRWIWIFSALVFADYVSCHSKIISSSQTDSYLS